MRFRSTWGCVFLLAVAPSTCFAATYVPGLRVVASDASGITVEYVMPGYRLEPVRTEAGTLQRVRVDGLAATVDEGQPELPMGGAWVALPPIGSASVRVLEEDVERVPAVDVSPVYRSEFVRDASGVQLPVRRFVRDPQAYARPGPYPQGSAALDGESWLRFQRVAALKFFPIRYEAMSRTLLVAKRMLVRVEFAAPAGRGLAALAAAGLESGPADDRQFEPVYRGAVLNYDAARSWRARPLARAGVTPAAPSRPQVTGTGNPEWKVRVDTTGVWRVSFAQLAAQSFPAGIAVDAVVAFRRDTTVALEPEPWTMAEIPIDVVDVNQNTTFDAGDFLVLPVQNWAERTAAGWYERRYGDAEMVWISYKSAGTGARVTTAASWLGALAPATPASFPSTRHYERNSNYYSFPLDLTQYDQFTWTSGNDDATPIDTLLADLLDLDPAGGSVHVKAEWIGRSNLAHLVSADWVRLVDNLATNLWTDTTAFSRIPFDAIKDFDAARAGEGLNRLRISGRSSAPNGASQAGFNWFEVTYPRRYVARNNRLDFNTGAALDTVEVHVSGFTGASAPAVYVYDVSDFAAPARLTVDPSQVVPAGGGWEVRLQVVAAPGAPRRLVAATDVAPLPDAAITRDTPSSLYLTGAADFIILTYDTFEPQVERLADFRRQKNITTLVAKSQDVYDEFNGGRKSQFAVRRFLNYALQHWNTRFVLLVGDASEDAQGWLRTSAPDFVPTPVIHGPVGVAEGLEVVPSDNWYVLGLTSPVENDLTADMVIGRWTASSAQQVVDLVDKSIAYETSPLDAPWRNRAVLSADDDFSAQTTFGGGGGGGFAYCERLSEQVFKAINQNLESLIKNEGGYRDFDVRPFYMIDLLTSVTTFPDGNCTYPGIGRDLFATLDYVRDHTAPALFTILNQGVAFWNFQGHGNAVQMTHEELYYTGLRDVDLIFNDGKPWIFSGYACHINNYANVNEGGVFGDGAGERMVNIPSKGAIASLASVGYELLPSVAATQFNVHVYRAFFVDPPYLEFAGQSGARVLVGEAAALGAMRMVATTTGLERLAARTYVLLGDPLAAVNFGPPRFFAHATDRDSIASGQAYYPTLDQDSVTVIVNAVDESALSNLTIVEEGEGARGALPDSEVVITPTYPDPVGNRYEIRITPTPRPASYDVVFSATDRSGLTGQFRLRFVLEVSLTQAGQVVRSGDPVVPGTDLVWKVRSPARLTAGDFALKLDDVVVPAFTATEDPSDTTGRTWSVTFSPALIAGSHKAQLDVALARGGASRQVEFDVLGGELSVRYAYAFPNPFHDRSTFNFFLGSDEPSDVLLRVFTVSGRPVWERFEKDVAPGYHQWEWDGRDEAGKTVAFGTYLFRLATAQGGDRKVASQGKIVRAPAPKPATSSAVTP